MKTSAEFKTADPLLQSPFSNTIKMPHMNDDLFLLTFGQKVLDISGFPSFNV
jgi:predicted glycosyltransferase